jgi:hypothetical protein
MNDPIRKSLTDILMSIDGIDYHLGGKRNFTWYQANPTVLPPMLKKFFNMATKTIIIILLATCSNIMHGQTVNSPFETFVSSKYGYSIIVPKSFKKTESSRKNIDLKFADDYGSSILLNITDRLPEENGIDAHSYTNEMLENEIRRIFPNFKISHSEKIYVDKQKAFLTESTGGDSPKLKEMNCYFYYKDKAYLITCSSEIERFENYKKIFQNVIQSIKLKK